MRRRNFIQAVFCAAAAWPLIARAQQPAETPRTRPPQSIIRRMSAVTNKTQLVDQFRQLEHRYRTIKALTAKYAPLKPHHPSAVKQARSKLAARMVVYEKLEAEIQKTLDSTNEMNDFESMALQNKMQRASQIIETLSNIMKKMSESGDSIVQNIK